MLLGFSLPLWSLKLKKWKKITEAFLKAPRCQYLFQNCLSKAQHHSITIASLLKQNTHCTWIWLQSGPLLKGKGETSGAECNSQSSLFISPNTPVSFKRNHTVNVPQAVFTRENCFEDDCFVAEAREFSVIYREDRHALIHPLLPLHLALFQVDLFPWPRMYGSAFSPHKWRDFRVSFWGNKWWLNNTVNECTKNAEMYILRGWILWYVHYFLIKLSKKGFLLLPLWLK